MPLARSLAFAALLAGALAVLPAAPAAAAEGDYVIVFAEGVDPAAMTARLQATAGVRAGYRYDSAVKGISAHLTDAQRTRLETDPAVAFVAPDVPFRADGTVAVAPKEVVPAGIRRTRAATTTQVRAAANSAVAVIDSGLDLASGDLNAADGVNCITPGARAQDDSGHGTHVGGTIAGRNSGTGVAGMSPGTRLYAVKVIDGKGGGTLSSILCGVDWVTRNAAALDIRVANMSVGAAGSADGNCGRTKGDALHDALCRSVAAGITYVASAGNAKVSLAGAVPAAYPEVLTVTAMTDTDGAPGGRGPVPCAKGEADDSPWSGTNFATTTADAAHLVAAPGSCVVSTKRQSGTLSMTGTSMAAPHVAGAVALCIGNGGVAGPCAGLTPAETVQRIRSDAQAAATAGFGFTGDLLKPVTGRILGPLVSAAAY